MWTWGRKANDDRVKDDLEQGLIPVNYTVMMALLHSIGR